MSCYHVIHNSTDFYESLLSMTAGRKEITESGFLYTGEASSFSYEIERFIFSPGFEAAFHKITINEPFSFPFIPQYEGIELTAFLADEDWQRMKSIRCRLMFLLEDKSLSPKLEYRIDPGCHHAFNIYLDQSWLQNFLDVRTLFPRKYVDAYVSIPDNDADRFSPVLSALKNPGINGVSRHIFLQAKAMELFSLSLDFIAEQKTESPVSMHKEDILALKNVRSEIENNYADPPSLKELSRKYCMNMRKLTEGYKQLYGITIYETVLACRMKRAFFCLRNLNLNVSEAAAEAGYIHQSHFIETFRRYYGFTPGQIKHQLKQPVE